MKTLEQVLQDYDFGLLKVIAELWGLDPPRDGSIPVVRGIAAGMLHPEAAGEQVEGLPPPARQALDDLLTHQGRFPFADFARRYGPLREMGPGRRGREKPWREGASPLEALWYRGLVARAFAESAQGVQEFAFVPSDLVANLPAPAPSKTGSLGHGFPQHELSHVLPATSAAVDDATTLLGNLRRQPLRGGSLPQARRRHVESFLIQPSSLDLLIALLREVDILEENGVLQPHPEAARRFLELPRAAALRRLLLAWQASRTWNDLAQGPGLSPAQGPWPNDPFSGRQEALNFLARVPQGAWWDLEAVVSAVRVERPGFLRPAGDFDSWYLRDADSGAFLRGFEHWERIDGAFLRNLVRGPLHWLGAADLGAVERDGPTQAFRLTPFAATFFDPLASPKIEEPQRRATARPDGSLTVPRETDSTSRYQIARVSEWVSFDGEAYRYQLTPRSLGRAAEQGLQVAHIRSFLQAATERPLPPPLARALERWSARGGEGRLEQLLVLRVSDPAVLQELRAARATARYLGASLGPEALIVSESNWPALCAASARLGILLDPPAENATEGP